MNELLRSDATIPWCLHQLKTLSSFLLETAFSPKQMAQQVGIILALQSIILSAQVVKNGVVLASQLLTQKGRMKRALEIASQNAETYDEWEDCARKLDEFMGMQKWIENDMSPLYDSRLLRRRIIDIKKMMVQNDVFNLIFKLRGGLSRDQFSITNEALYLHATAGTKAIIEEYQQTICDALYFICQSKDTNNGMGDDECVPLDVRLAFFNETRHSYGRTALLLSGGASLGYYHIGLAKCLLDNNMLPRVISGASAGSLMAAMIGTRTGEELVELIEKGDFRKDFFSFGERKSDNISARFHYLVPQSLRWIPDMVMRMIFEKESVLKLDTNHLKEAIIANVGHHTFQEAFDRTGRIVNITVAPNNKYEPPRLLNYLTAPHICVWSAAVASCAIPGVFDSIALVSKEPNGDFRPENDWVRHRAHDSADDKLNLKYSDGSIENDLPMQQLSELFNINHFIVSQVNPHSFLLSSLSLPSSAWNTGLINYSIGYIKFLKAQCRSWLKNMINFITFRNSAPSWSSRRGVGQLLTQEYEGRDCDVSIMPWKGAMSIGMAFASLMKNPSLEDFHRMVKISERNTWPHVPRIKAHCAIEVTLDKCVQLMRTRISQESREDDGQDRDRTPSFFTSRSLINLSGLSVTDPKAEPRGHAADWEPRPLRQIIVAVDKSFDGQDELSKALDKERDKEVKDLSNGIVKTTRMTNFYYKKSKSDELASLVSSDSGDKLSI